MKSSHILRFTNRRQATLAVLTVAVTSVSPLEVVAQQLGHRVLGTQVTVNRRSHWEAWKIAGGTISITDDGVTPRFIRKSVNAALESTQFALEENGQAVDAGPGGVYVGSNAADASALIDGDVATTWGPMPTAESFYNGEWWAEINLGRVVYCVSPKRGRVTPSSSSRFWRGAIHRRAGHPSSGLGARRFPTTGRSAVQTGQTKPRESSSTSLTPSRATMSTRANQSFRQTAPSAAMPSSAFRW